MKKEVRRDHLRGPAAGCHPRRQVLVHNSARPTRFIGYRGFRAWLEPASKYLTVCPCDWASELGQHYRVSIFPPS